MLAQLRCAKKSQCCPHANPQAHETAIFLLLLGAWWSSMDSLGRFFCSSTIARLLATEAISRGAIFLLRRRYVFCARLTEAIFLLSSHPRREDVRSYGRFFLLPLDPANFYAACWCDFFAPVGGAGTCAPALREKIAGSTPTIPQARGRAIFLLPWAASGSPPRPSRFFCDRVARSNRATVRNPIFLRQLGPRHFPCSRARLFFCVGRLRQGLLA